MPRLSFKLRNWRTTACGLCAAVCYFFHDVGGLPHWAKLAIKLAGALGVFLGGVAAVDARQLHEAVDEETKKYARHFRRH